MWKNNRVSVVALKKYFRSGKSFIDAIDYTESKMKEENIGPNRPNVDPSENSKIIKSLHRMSKAELIQAYQELALQYKEKEKRIAELNTADIIELNAKESVLSDAIDITKRKRAEKKLLQLNKELEQRVAERTEKLAASEDLLHKSNALARIGSWEVDLLKATIYWDNITREIHEADNGFTPDLATSINFYKEGQGRKLITQKVNEAIEQCKPWDLELEIVTAKNNVRWIRTIGEPEIINGKCEKIYGSFQDISQQKVNEEKIKKISRLYLFISEINQMIVRLSDEATLFAETCRIAVELGTFRMVWIGMIDEATKRVIPVNVAGEELGYLSNLTGISAADVPKGMGPTGTAIREGKYIVCNDIENDPRMLPWKNAALERGYLSNIALPIKKSGKVVGAITFYASEKNFFDIEEINMLEKATADVAFALELFDKERDRRKAETALEISNERLLIAQEISHIGYWEQDLITGQRYWSEVMFKIFGIKKTMNVNDMETFMKFVHPEDRQKLIDSHTAMIERNIPQNLEFRIIQKDGSIKYLISKAKVILDTNWLPIRLEGTQQDITERKNAENKLVESENYLRIILDTEPECVKVLNRNGELVSMNPAGLAMIEADNKEHVLGHRMMELVDKKYQVGFKRLTNEVFKGNSGAFEFEITGLKGGRRWMETHAVPLKDSSGKIINLLGVTRDITEQKKAEEERNKTTEQIRILITHLQTIREDERKRIAREIHDHMGQQLSAIKMDAVWIDKQISAEQFALKGKLQNIIELLDESHLSVHKILNELRPTELDNHGLLEVLQWLGKQFTESTGTPVHFVSNLSNINLPQEISACIFRVYQEALTNIMRYAGAGKVVSSLSVINEKIVLTIEDDGKGFNIDLMQNKKSFGLLGMKERVHSLNGKIDFVSSPGKGTKILIGLPYKKTLL